MVTTGGSRLRGMEPEIREMCKTMTLVEISRRTGVKHSTVWEYCNRHGIPLLRARVRHLDYEAVALQCQTMTKRQISEANGVSYPSVWAFLKKHRLSAQECPSWVAFCKPRANCGTKPEGWDKTILLYLYRVATFEGEEVKFCASCGFPFVSTANHPHSECIECYCP